MRVAAFLAVPQDAVALTVGDPTGIGVADGVAVGTPVGRVGAFELLQAGHDGVVQAHESEDAHHAGRAALSLAVGAPRDDHRHPVGAGRAEDVDVDGDAVAQGDGHIFVQHDVHGEVPEGLGNPEPCGQGAGARVVVAEDAVPGVAWLQGLGRHEDLFLTHR